MFVCFYFCIFSNKIDINQATRFTITEQYLCRVFNSRRGHAYICHAVTLITKTAKLKVEKLGQGILKGEVSA